MSPNTWDVHKVVDGDVLVFKTADLRRARIVAPMVCCNCQLTHMFTFTINGGALEIEIQQHEDITEELRELAKDNVHKMAVHVKKFLEDL